MSTLEAFILGIVQGLTEFLPISSSGHLTLGQYFFGIKNLDQYIVFNLVCHLGTLCSILIVYASYIKELYKNNRIRLIQVIVGTLPLFPLLLVLKPIEKMYDEVQYIGYFFLTTALLLYSGIRWGSDRPITERQQTKWRDATIIGSFQALAVLPGVSRSGSTISGARLLGWDRNDAVSFSFLLAIPAILGGITIKTLQLLFTHTEVAQLTNAGYLAGFTSSLITGWFALLLVIRLAMKEKLMYFVWYCLLLGTGTILYFS